MNCCSTCPTPGVHESFGECVRAKGVRVGWSRSAAGVDLTTEKRHVRELVAYRDARRQGVQPATTKIGDIRRALDISDRTGKAFEAV